MSSKLASEAKREASALAFLSRQFLESVPATPKSVDLSGQTAIVTGSNTGLGLDCARQLLHVNLSHLVLAVRSQSKGDVAAQHLRKLYPAARIEVLLVDMSSYRSVIAFAKQCESLARLDIAILNAGLRRPSFERADESKHEMTFQINYLSTALLATLLIPVLKSKRGTSAPGRLAMVGSDTAYWAAWDDPHGTSSVFEAVDDASKFDSFGAYKVSKLFLNMFLEKLSERVSPDDVIVNVPNPGACSGTAFGADDPSRLARFMFHLMSMIISRPVSTGARQYVDAVTAQGPESHGSFVSEGRVKPFPPLMYTDGGRSLQANLWNETMKELEFAGVSNILALG